MTMSIVKVPQLIKSSYLAIFLVFILTCKKDYDADPSIDYMVYTQNKGLIGSGGGEIKLIDQSSSLNGSKILIPQGSLSKNFMISIKSDNSVRPLGDSSVSLIDLQPDGLTFAKPVIIKIPISNSIQNPGLFCFNPDSDLITQVPIINIDRSNGFITAELTHFSRYYIEENRYIFFDVNLYNTGNSLKANIVFGGEGGLNNVPVNLLNFFTSLGMIQNAKQAIDYGIPALGTSPESLYGTIWANLKTGGKTIKSIKLAVQRKGLNPTEASWVKVKMIQPEEKILFTSAILDQKKREDFFSGRALVFDFNTVPEIGKQYYLELKWCLSDNSNGYSVPSTRFTNVFKITTLPEDLISLDPDKNKNLIEDNYDHLMNSPPGIPTIIGPSPGETQVSTTAKLEWSCKDLENDILYFDVYFGTDPIPSIKLSTEQLNCDFQQNNLEYNTTYFWRVTAKDRKGPSSTGPIWSFTTKDGLNTPPEVPTNPFPEDGAKNVGQSTVLSWYGTDSDNDQLTFNIFFGKEINPTIQISKDQQSTSFSVGNLMPGTSYFWKVIAVDNKKHMTTSPVWSFTTSLLPNNPPNSPTNPNPINGSSKIILSPTLTWNCYDPDNDKLLYNIYLGTDSNSLTPIATDLNEPSVVIKDLLYNTKYYWKIIAIDPNGSKVSGEIWNFTTVPPNQPPNQPSDPSPTNGETEVSTFPNLKWNCSDFDGDNISYDILLDQGTNPVNIIEENYPSTNISIRNLVTNTRYFWKVIAKDIHGNSSMSPVWSFITTSVEAKKPTVETSNIVSYSSISANITGNVISDGGATVTERGFYYGTIPNPEYSGRKLQIGGGIGIYSINITDLIPNTTYYVKAYAGNILGYSYALNQLSFTTKADGETGVLVDIDQNIYKTITIGSQTWMSENLKSTKFNDGTSIPYITDQNTWYGLYSPGYCWYNNDASYKSTYGALYNWYTVNTKKICPIGWHVPTNSELLDLKATLGDLSLAGGKMKEEGFIHWLPPNSGATNSTGFTGLPGGMRTHQGNFLNINSNGYWWTSFGDYTHISADSFGLNYDKTIITGWDIYQGSGFSIRCIMDQAK